MTKGYFGDEEESDFYGVLQEVLELQYGTNKHGNRSVFLFRCDWYDLASWGTKIKDDGYFKSINTSAFWYKNSPFILASQAGTCFFLDDTKFDHPWKVVQKFSHRHVYDVPEKKVGDEDAFEVNGDPYQEEEGSLDPIYHDVDDVGDEEEVEDEGVDHPDEVVRVDSHIVRDLANQEVSHTAESEDEQEQSLHANGSDYDSRVSNIDSDVE